MTITIDDGDDDSNSGGNVYDVEEDVTQYPVRDVTKYPYMLRAHNRIHANRSTRLTTGDVSRSVHNRRFIVLYL